MREGATCCLHEATADVTCKLQAEESDLVARISLRRTLSRFLHNLIFFSLLSSYEHVMNEMSEANKRIEMNENKTMTQINEINVVNDMNRMNEANDMK